MYLKNELLLTKHLPLISTILRNKAKKRCQQNNSKLVIKAINVLVLPLSSVFLNWKKNELTFENNRGNSDWNI